MDELNHLIDNQNIPEMTDAEMTSLSVSRVYMNRLIESEPGTSLRYHQESGNHNEPKKRRQVNKCLNLMKNRKRHNHKFISGQNQNWCFEERVNRNR